MFKQCIIAKKDFKTYFFSPIGYLFLSAVMFLIGFMFFQRLVALINYLMMSMQMGQPLKGSLNQIVLKPIFDTFHLFFVFIIPLLTMRLLSEEKKLKTIELLFTSPIGLFDIVLGKFLSAFLFVALMLACTFIYPLVLLMGGSPDFGQIFTTYVGLLLVGACYVSLGLFWSSVTENQIISAVLTFVSLLFLWIISWVGQNTSGWLTSFVSYLSVMNHYNSFSDGVISLKDTFYFFSFISVGLYLTYLGLESKNWK